MSHGEFIFEQQLADFLGQLEQAQQVGDVAAAFMDGNCQLLLFVGKFEHQTLIACRFFERV